MEFQNSRFTKIYRRHKKRDARHARTSQKKLFFFFFVKVDPDVACIPSGLATHRATAPGLRAYVFRQSIPAMKTVSQ